MDEERAIIFEPQSGDMFEDYPELKEIAEFKMLYPFEMKFVWYFAYPRSPLAGLPTNERREESAMLACEGDMLATKSDRMRLKTGRFPDRVKEAIVRMANIQSDMRERAYRDTLHVFKQYGMLLRLTDDDINAMEMENKKRYVDMTAKILTNFPVIIQLLERRFGLPPGAERKQEKIEVNTTQIIREISQEQAKKSR